MERILVPVIRGQKHFGSVLHGLQLAQRIGLSVVVLEVETGITVEGAADPSAWPGVLTQQCSEWLARATSKEVYYEIHRVKGEFCSEIRQYCQTHPVSTLILDMSLAGETVVFAELLKMASDLQRLKLCKVELLGKK